jgi:death on curing protein
VSKALLSTDDVLRIHYALVNLFAEGRDPIVPAGPRPGGLLESAITRPATSIGGIEKYKSVEAKAAALFHSLVSNHPFHNGNKRTALVSTIVFLDRNDRRITATDDDLFDFVLRVAGHQGEFSGGPDEVVEAVSKWLKQHCPPAKQKPSSMRLGEFLERCTDAGCSVKKAGGGQSWVIRGPNGKSIRVGGDTRQLDGNVVRSYVTKLGLSDAASGIRLDEFQSGVDPEQALMRQLRQVLDRLANA